MFNPILDKSLVDDNACIEGVIPGDRRSIRLLAVATVRLIGICRLLSSILSYAEPTQGITIFGHIANHGDGNHTLGLVDAVFVDQLINVGRGTGPGVSSTIKI